MHLTCAVMMVYQQFWSFYVYVLHHVTGCWAMSVPSVLRRISKIELTHTFAFTVAAVLPSCCSTLLLSHMYR